MYCQSSLRSHGKTLSHTHRIFRYTLIHMLTYIWWHKMELHLINATDYLYFFVSTVMFYVKCFVSSVLSWVWLPCSMIIVQDGGDWWCLSLSFSVLWMCLSLTVWVLLCCFQGRLIVYSTSVERWRKKRLCFVRRVRLHSNHGLLLRLHGKSATSPPDLYTDP